MEIFPSAEFMFYIRGLISKNLCQRIIEDYRGDPRKLRGRVVNESGKTKSQHDIKLSTDLEIPPDGAWTATFRELNAAVNHAIQTVVARIPSLQIWPLQWTGYKIQHYKKDEGYFKWHFDALGPGTWDRQIAMIVYLNSVQEGGETCFHLQNLKIKPVAGDAVLFPTFWTHAHCGEIPRSEDKYIITSFISFAIPEAEHKTA